MIQPHANWHAEHLCCCRCPIRVPHSLLLISTSHLSSHPAHHFSQSILAIYYFLTTSICTMEVFLSNSFYIFGTLKTKALPFISFPTWLIFFLPRRGSWYTLYKAWTRCWWRQEPWGGSQGSGSSSGHAGTHSLSLGFCIMERRHWIN